MDGDHPPRRGERAGHDRRRPLQPAARDRLGDHRHLQRCREDPALTDRTRAHLQLRGHLIRGRDRARPRARERRAGIPAVPLGHRDQAPCADPHAERRVHRVAGLDEALSHVDAARLAVGVRQLHPIDHRVGRDGKRRGGLRDVPLENGRERYQLECGARRLRCRERDPGERPDLRRPGVEDGYPAHAPRERALGGRLEPEVDRRANRVSGTGRSARDAPGARVEGAPRPARHLRLEDCLEPAVAHRPVPREPARVEGVALGHGRGRPHPTGDRAAGSGRNASGRAARHDRAAVAGQDRRAPRRVAPPVQDLAGLEAREHELRRPLHARSGHRQLETPGERAEQTRAELEGDRRPPGRVADLAGGGDPGRGRRLGRGAIGALEGGEGVATPGFRGDERAHRAVVGALPGGDEPPCSGHGR